MRFSFVKYLIPSVFLLSYAGYKVVEQGAPYAIIQPRKITTGTKPEDLGLVAEHFKLPVADSLLLDAYYMPPPSIDSTKPTVILLHGIGGNKESWVQTAAMLGAWGYPCLLYDARAHGQSDGQYYTLGYYEKHDVSAAIDWLTAHHPSSKVGVMGNSMGGAVALQALALEPRLNFGIVECAFTDLHSVIHAYQTRYAQGIHFEDLTDASLVKAGEIARFDPQQVCPVCDAAKITQPILLIHGSKDINIDPKSMDAIYDALASEHKEKIRVDGADHYSIMAVGGDSLRLRMHRFLDAQKR